MTGKRAWRTREGDAVRTGDRVAVSTLDYPDAIGVILGWFMGRIDFRITEVKGKPFQRRVQVDEDQLVMKLPKGKTCCTGTRKHSG